MAIYVYDMGLPDMRAGPRRFLWRQTLGRLRSEEVSLGFQHLCVLQERAGNSSLHGLVEKACKLCLLQAVYTSAVTKAQYVRDATLADAAEAEKLLQRQSAAREQYDQGLAKLRATSRQLQSLASRVCVLHTLAVGRRQCTWTRLPAV